MKLYAPLAKAETLDDGTVRIRGVASAETVDSAGEIIKADAMRAALPDFMRLGSGALREMHQLSAAGTVDSAEVTKAGETIIVATVVDETAIRKIRAKVYKGFSVGGRVLKREKNVITALKLTEISLVDTPCNSSATFTLWKTYPSAPGVSCETIRRAVAAEMASMSSDERALLLMRATHVAAGREIRPHKDAN